MKLKDRIIRWMGAISCTEADRIANRLLDVQHIDHKRLKRFWHEERARANRLQRRLDELHPAFAECVAGLREIVEKRYGLVNLQIATRTLNRLQIPDDHLPTKGYPRDAS